MKAEEKKNILQTTSESPEKKPTCNFQIQIAITRMANPGFLFPLCFLPPGNKYHNEVNEIIII